jgi:hypothetical protein
MSRSTGRRASSATPFWWLAGSVARLRSANGITNSRSTSAIADLNGGTEDVRQELVLGAASAAP